MKLRMRELMILMILVMVSSAQATQSMPVKFKTTVDFKGERDFVILMPNGLERHFFWDDNETHSDVTFNHTIYYDIDEVEFCNEYANLGVYVNVSDSLAEMMGLCSSMITQWNDTQKLRDQANEAIRDRELYRGMNEACEENLKSADNFSETVYDDAIGYRQEADRCQQQLNTLQRESGNIESCNTELSAAVSSRTNYLFGGAALGIGVGYMLWKRKKEAGGPSEQSESGTAYDQIGQPSKPAPIFKDGPEE